MAYRTWVRLLLTAFGVSLLAGAGQLGIAFGLGVVRLTGTFTGTTVNQWPAQLVWVGWFAANAAVVGAVLTERLARRDQALAGTGRQLGVAGAAALGATVVAPLCMQPARAAELISVDPVWAVAICAILGAVVGAGAASAVLLRPPVGWNVAAVAGAVWLLALISVVPSLASTGQLPTVRLGVLEPPSLDADAAQRLALVVLPLVALLAGAATGGLARWRGHPPLVGGATGAAGPVLVAFTYLAAGPGDQADRYQLTPYYAALIAVVAGGLGSAAAALLRWPLVTRTAGSDAIEPTDILRALPAGPALPGAATPADPPADEPETLDLAGAGLAGTGRPGGTQTALAGSGGSPAHWDWPAPSGAPTAPTAADHATGPDPRTAVELADGPDPRPALPPAAADTPPPAVATSPAAAPTGDAATPASPPTPKPRRTRRTRPAAAPATAPEPVVPAASDGGPGPDRRPPTTATKDSPTSARDALPAGDPTAGPGARAPLAGPVPTDRPTPTPAGGPTPTDRPTPTPVNGPPSAPVNGPASTATDRPAPTPVNGPTSASTRVPVNGPIPAPVDRPTAAPVDRPASGPAGGPTGQQAAGAVPPETTPRPVTPAWPVPRRAGTVPGTEVTGTRSSPQRPDSAETTRSAIAASRPADPDQSSEQVSRPRHRAPMPDLSRAASWDAFATARRVGPPATPDGGAAPRSDGTGASADTTRIDWPDAAAPTTAAGATTPDGAPAESTPGVAADSPTNGAGAEQPRGRRGRLGLFRRNRPRTGEDRVDAPADREAEPLPAQDEEFVDWVTGLSRPVLDNEPEQESGRRSLRSTGRHHRE